jgi:hypothetical protein
VEKLIKLIKQNDEKINDFIKKYLFDYKYFYQFDFFIFLNLHFSFVKIFIYIFKYNEASSHNTCRRAILQAHSPIDR